jgi:hypothetical protein
MKKNPVIEKLVSKWDKKNYYGYDADWKAYDMQRAGRSFYFIVYDILLNTFVQKTAQVSQAGFNSLSSQW